MIDSLWKPELFPKIIVFPVTFDRSPKASLNPLDLGDLLRRQFSTIPFSKRAQRSMLTEPLK